MELTSIDSAIGHRRKDARVLFVLPSLGAGGSERVVTTLANHMAKQGRQVGIANFDGPADNPFYPLAPEVALYRLDLPASRGGLLDQLGQTARRIQALKRVYRDFQPDAVISFLTKANIMALLAAGRKGPPVIISERNNPTLQSFNALWRAARAYTYPKAFSFVTMTRGAAEYYPERQRPRTRIIPNPVNLPEDWQDRREGNTITAVGRLTDQKQFHLLIEAFARIAEAFADWNLVIWGEGERRADLEKQRARLGLDDRIALPGLTERPGQWVETADVFALSSAYEGWPNVIVEAMAARLPVVSFDCEHGVADMIEDGVSGCLVPQGNVSALADALASVLGDPTLRHRLADGALEASARYDTDTIANQWIEIVDEALAAR
ncbi:MAG: glycosyltransferase family 4 protein [Erythrobacter sp.]|uniref:glycosyltransferase family 4 protein n=1 Tax=Erythrobacter sp. TaxID=1042 RepID=UPI00261753E5|nr:glycosyltransferase family 4 protein [Erythrobacter sp.]MDJ0979601.1 glycosyltransferase family 4 protein [Erythrobacter sp.]